jgi:trans-2,3-dihydro-3-hydroxyanthranilate isomerase
MGGLAYYHVDVFTRRPFGGNSLAVIPEAQGLSAEQMLAITQELRHFESIFLEKMDDGIIRARIFDLIEELDFAGHPCWVLRPSCISKRTTLAGASGHFN